MEESALYVKSTSPWKVELSGADLKGRNPSLFRLAPFADFSAAWNRIDNALKSSAVKTIENIALSLTFNPPQFEALLDKLNDLASGWEVHLYGSYADGIDPYTARASQSPDGRFPIFMWQPARTANGLYYQADIVPTPEGRYLEIHSNCGDMKQLLKEAESTTGVKFTPVETL
jgi:hypothetical protein